MLHFIIPFWLIPISWVIWTWISISCKRYCSACKLLAMTSSSRLYTIIVISEKIKCEMQNETKNTSVEHSKIALGTILNEMLIFLSSFFMTELNTCLVNIWTLHSLEPLFNALNNTLLFSIYFCIQPELCTQCAKAYHKESNFSHLDLTDDENKD